MGDSIHGGSETSSTGGGSEKSRPPIVRNLLLPKIPLLAENHHPKP